MRGPRALSAAAVSHARTHGPSLTFESRLCSTVPRPSPATRERGTSSITRPRRRSLGVGFLSQKKKRNQYQPSGISEPNTVNPLLRACLIVSCMLRQIKLSSAWSPRNQSRAACSMLHLHVDPSDSRMMTPTHCVCLCLSLILFRTNCSLSFFLK